MGFFDGLFRKAVPASVRSLDYKVSCRNREYLSEGEFESKLNVICNQNLRMDSQSDIRLVVRELEKLSRNSNLSRYEKDLVMEKIDYFRKQ